ncbi:DnaD domain protein [Peptacetobacter hominis]|uniref:DnaD domain protein n=1 Tax=Peptacetobacter hominis TaxID=2743610 RepID=A0A544QV28_9FIRM|nr:DnaD domain protein [Peptacetobacter hominis]TQQ84549.1 DnaD domain protein [Peptacetobacter hominis]
MFFVENNDRDFGQTTIPNVFIDLFMPMADGLSVKVYLLGYKTATMANPDPKQGNEYIASNLNVPLSDVLKAWEYWESQNIVKIHRDDIDNRFNFSVEFMNLNYMDFNKTSPISSDADMIVLKSENTQNRKMFNEINKIVGRYLEPGEKISLLDIKEKFNMSPDMIVLAYQITKDRTGTSKPVKYIESILRNWYDSCFYTVDDVKNSMALQSERYMMYRAVFDYLGFRRQPSKSEKDVMNTWFDVYNIDIELALEACSKSKNISNPSIAYIDGIIKKWADASIRTIEELRKFEEAERAEKEREKKEKDAKQNSTKKKSSTPSKNNSFKNFDETFTRYSADELNDLIKKSQSRKFK